MDLTGRPTLKNFHFAEAIYTAVEQLDLLGAVDRKDEHLSLTPLGKKMASFPLEPSFAKVRAVPFPPLNPVLCCQKSLTTSPCDLLQTILLSPEFSCTEEVLTIVSLLSVDSVLYNPPARREEAHTVRRKFISSEGDHMTLLNIYRAFKNVGGNKVKI